MAKSLSFFGLPEKPFTSPPFWGRASGYGVAPARVHIILEVSAPHRCPSQTAIPSRVSPSFSLPAVKVENFAFGFCGFFMISSGVDF